MVPASHKHVSSTRTGGLCLFCSPWRCQKWEAGLTHHREFRDYLLNERKVSVWYQTYVKTFKKQQVLITQHLLNEWNEGYEAGIPALGLHCLDSRDVQPFCLSTSALCQPLPSGGWLKSLGAGDATPFVGCSLTPQKPVPQPSLEETGPHPDICKSLFLFLQTALTPRFRYV